MNIAAVAGYLGAGIGMGLSAIGSAVGEGHAAGRTLEGIARQPAVRESLVRNMLIGQAIAETPGIFALVVAVLLIFSAGSSESWVRAAALLGAGLSVGTGALGSAVGCGAIGGSAVAASSRNPARTGNSLRMMIFAQALCQSTVVYALVVALILWGIGREGVQTAATLVEQIPRAAALLGAGFCMGFGAVGPAIGTGEAGAAAAEGVTLYPDGETPVTRTFLVGAAVSQTTAVYALVVALILMFAV